MRKPLASLLLIVAIFTQGGLATAQSHPAINFDADDLVTGWTIQSDEDSFWQPLQTQGWNLRLSEPAVLTHLAMYDYGGDGLQGDFRIGLWGSTAWFNIDGTWVPLGDEDFFVEGTVLGGTEAPLVGSWRLVDIEDVLLQPGGYVIGERLQSERNELCSGSPIFCDFYGGIENVEDQFFWNFDVGNDGGAASPSLIPNDPRVTVHGSMPLTNGQAFASTENAGFSIPTLPYYVQGAFVGPNLFLAPVPEPTTGVLTAIALLCMARPSRLT